MHTCYQRPPLVPVDVLSHPVSLFTQKAFDIQFRNFEFSDQEFDQMVQVGYGALLKRVSALRDLRYSRTRCLIISWQYFLN
mgnify:CR=1 FL=1